MELTKERQQKSVEELKKNLGKENPMAVPHLEKVVISIGTGKFSRTNKQYNEFVADRLARIAGQKAAPCPARKSVASFKIREGETIGYKVTLRGKRMFDFLDRLFNIAMPRMRDFRGISRHHVDEMGNLTVGIREHNVFPETAQEELKDVFGFAVTLVTSAKNREEGLALFEKIGVPFRTEEA